MLQLEKFKRWLQREENHAFIPGNTLTLILDELSSHKNVGIKVAGIFPLTYGLLASVCKN